MLSYLSIGANDPRASALFYEAVLLPLGYGRDDSGEAVRFSLPDVVDRDNGPGTVWVQRPFDGRPATPGNGMMPAFQAPDADMVKRLHAAGLAAGGADEGAPGTRDRYSDDFYVGYLRDPAGNKLSIFCILS